MSECRLLTCPPIGEAMHSLRQCFCHLCTCGEHKCPSALTTTHYLPSALHSTYKQNFTKKPPLPSEPFHHQSPRHISPSSKLVSTAQMDFVSHPVEKTPTAKYEKNTNLGALKFLGNSNYKREFPNWGAYEVLNVGKFERRVARRDFNLSPLTTYSENFKKMEVCRTQSQKRLDNRSPIVGVAEIERRTNNKESFRPMSKGDFPRRASNKNFGILQLESPKSAYQTLYKFEFDKKESPENFGK